MLLFLGMLVWCAAAQARPPTARVKALFRRGGTVHWLVQGPNGPACEAWKLRKLSKDGALVEVSQEPFTQEDGTRVQVYFEAQLQAAVVDLSGPTRMIHAPDGMRTEASGCHTLLTPQANKKGALQFDVGRWFLSRRACEGARKKLKPDAAAPSPWLTPSC